LFRPDRLAVIGGGAWSAAVIDQARRFGYPGEISAVHPRAETIAGVRTVPRIEDLENPPDAVFVGINRRATIKAVRALSEIGAGGAVCFASGFSEAEDADGVGLQADLIRAAGDMPTLGPNCYGFVNGLDRVAVWPDQHGMRGVDRGVAILTQSSNIAINLTMQRRAVPLAFMIACGNQAQTRQAEMASALLEDHRITGIGVHIEGFGDLRLWEDLAARARERRIPLVALKMGRSSHAQAATVSHTASLAGGDAGAQAFLDRLDILRVGDVPSFLETLKLLHVTGRLRSNRFSAISCSGGEASLVADQSVGRDLDLPPLTDPQKRTLREALGPMVALANPLDYHTYIWRDTEAMAKAWGGMVRSDTGITLSIVDYPHTDHTDWQCATRAALKVASITGQPFGMVATLPELMPEDIARNLLAGGVVPFAGLTEALTAIEQAARPIRGLGDPVLQPGLAEPTKTLTEAAAKDVLRSFGLDVPKSALVGQGDDVLAAVQGLSGPFAVKGQGLVHKTEADAVRLGIRADDLPHSVREIGTEIILIEEMVTEAVAELLVGVTRDPAHGFVLTLGAGGILTEILEDTVSLLIASSDQEVNATLDRLRIGRVLDGYRGKPAADRAAIAAAVRSVQTYVMDHAETVVELEINPLIVTPTRAVAADVLIRQGSTHSECPKQSEADT